MRTNIVIDEKLVRRAMKLAGVPTKRQAVEVALRHYVGTRDYSAVLALYRTGGVSPEYDPKAADPGPRRAKRAR